MRLDYLGNAYLFLIPMGLKMARQCLGEYINCKKMIGKLLLDRTKNRVIRMQRDQEKRSDCGKNG